MRLGIIYLLSVTSTDAVTDRRAYVGQTRRLLDVRVKGHKSSQPWGDLEIGAKILVRVPLFLLTVVEFLAIKIIRPTYNLQWNERNRRRVGRGPLVIARRARDLERREATARKRVQEAPASLYEPPPTRPPLPGIRLSEAIPHLGAAVTLDALRRASTRPGFPVPVGREGSSNLYLLDDLEAWRQRRSATR